MAEQYINIIPSLVPNTTTVLIEKDGAPWRYRITPIDGYVLHDKNYDDVILDENTGDVIRNFGYRKSTAGISASYDFSTLLVTDEFGNTYTAYGAQNEFFTVLESEVPADMIFGGGNTNHEVM